MNFLKSHYLYLFSLLLFSCSSNGQKKQSFETFLNGLLSESVPQISVDSLHTLSLKSVITILDARGIEEFNVSHLPNAKWVGYGKFKIENITYEKTDPIIIYCSVGYRSEKIGEQLLSNGYTNVYNLRGGVFDWVNKGYSVVNNIGSTQKVHGYSKTWGVWLNNKSNIVYE